MYIPHWSHPVRHQSLLEDGATSAPRVLAEVLSVEIQKNSVMINVRIVGSAQAEI